jgi:hypothetical protein
MPFVSGFLRVRRRGGRPDNSLPGEEAPIDPDYGVDEGDLPEVEPPEPPIGIWPPLTPEHPWRPIDPGFGHGRPEHPSTGPVPTPPTPPAGGIGGRPPDTRPEPPELPPGTIWPPLPPGVHGKYLALVLVAGMPGVKYRYVVIDADLRPSHPITPGGGEAQPKG